MENNNLSRVQKFVRFFSSASKFEKIKAESMQWRFKCTCSKETSIWEIGGIRYKASGDTRVGLRCPACGVLAMQRLYKVEGN
jgi:hypothetical protein